MKPNPSQSMSGQAMITVLFIMVVGLLVTTGAAYTLIGNTQAATSYEIGSIAHDAAESGVENAILRYIRNPSYTGETLSLGTNISALITVSTASGIVITSTGSYGNSVRRVEVHMHYNGGMLVIDSWKDNP